jgi:hypothetical protein
MCTSHFVTTFSWLHRLLILEWRVCIRSLYNHLMLVWDLLFWLFYSNCIRKKNCCGKNHLQFSLVKFLLSLVLWLSLCAPNCTLLFSFSLVPDLCLKYEVAAEATSSFKHESGMYSLYTRILRSGYPLSLVIVRVGNPSCPDWSLTCALWISKICEMFD